MDLDHLKVATLSRFRDIPLLDEDFLKFIEDAADLSFLRFGRKALTEAWNVFFGWEEAQDLDNLARSRELWMFRVWFLFHWKPFKKSKGPFPDPYAFAQSQLLGKLPASQEGAPEIFAHAGSMPMDFFEIYHFPEHQAYYVKSLLVGVSNSAFLRELPRTLAPGMVVFGKVLRLEGDYGAFLANSEDLGISAKVDVARLKRMLIALRKEEFLQNFSSFDSDIFDLYRRLQARSAI